MINYPITISTWNTTTNEKGFKVFENKEEFLPYVQSMFKIPGKYNLKNTRATWQHAACAFLKNGYYTNAIKDSIAFKDFWIKQERPRMVDGIEIDGFYLPPFFYQYLNYNMIQHKRSKKFTFPDVRDTDYHTFLYFMLCFIKGKHAVICKTRQRGFSLKITAILYWRYMWFDKSINTMGASDEKYVKKSWIFLEWFRQHINEHTPFLRGPQQAKKLDWEEFILTKDFKKRGKQSILRGVTFKTSPTNDVGGQQDIFFYEECFGKGTKIRMFDLSLKNIEDIKIGDSVLGVDSKPKIVKNICNGFDNLYKVEQQKGVGYIVNSKHKLILEQKCNSKNYLDDGEKIYTAPEFLSIKNKYKRQTTYGIKSEGINLGNADTLIPPYLLGAWLGDGSTNSTGFTVNVTKDQEIYDYLKNNEYGLQTTENISLDKYSDDVRRVTLSSGKDFNNQFRTDLKRYNIFSDKRIPESYLKSSRETRLELLAGLLDTDGNIIKNTRSYSFSYQITCTKKDLAEDIILLCRSLGLYTHIKLRPAKKTILKKTGKIINSKEFLRISIRGDVKSIPVKVERKKIPVEWIPTSNPLNTRIEIKPIGLGEYFGIELDGKNDIDHRLFLEDFTIVHNCGIAPTMLETLGYIRNAIEDGDEVTGFMVVSGSVGQLDHCKDLEILMKKPESENFLAVENVYDDDKFPKEMGLFIPDEWSLGGFIDDDGNSLVEQAVEYIKQRDADAKKNKSAEAYRLYQSQNPSKPSVAFALRKDSRFPTARIERQQGRILAEEKRQPKKVEIFEEDNKIKWKASNGEEVKYPVDMTQENKDGVVLMWEPPDASIVDENFAYFAGVDTIASNITSTSESLYSVYIFKGGIETTFEEGDVKKVRLETFRMVASWTGRIQSSDGLNKTNKIGELLVRLYKAHTYVERNHPNFIGHMQRKGWTWPKLLKEKDVPLLKEMDLKDTSGEYGVYMDNTGKKMDFIIDNVIAYLDDEIDVIFQTGKDGIVTEDVAKTVYGVERINDYWLLEEMKLWYPGRNADRLQAFGLGLCAAKSFFQNKIYKKKSEVTNRVITPPKPRIIDPMGSVFRQTKTKRTIYL